MTKVDEMMLKTTVCNDCENCGWCGIHEMLYCALDKLGFQDRNISPYDVPKVVMEHLEDLGWKTLNTDEEIPF